MRVFVTGSTGYIGSAVVGALAGAGHDVVGLVHSPGSESTARDLGAEPVVGAIEDPATYEEAAADADALVHLAFDFDTPVETDRAAIETLLDAARGATGERIFVYTSGCWVLGDTGDQPADESAEVDPPQVVAWRPAHEDHVIGASADDGVVTAVVRPGMVYGGTGGIVTGLFQSAERTAAAEFVGDGWNRWSLVHREDLADLYRRIVEEKAEGLFHAVDGSPARVIEVARTASELAGAGGETRSIPLEDARESMGAMADALVLDQVLSANRARELGWAPARASFLDAAGGAYREYRAGSAGE